MLDAIDGGGEAEAGDATVAGDAAVTEPGVEVLPKSFLTNPNMPQRRKQTAGQLRSAQEAPEKMERQKREHRSR